jgi:hypothetical protein
MLLKAFAADSVIPVAPNGRTISLLLSLSLDLKEFWITSSADVSAERVENIEEKSVRHTTHRIVKCNSVLFFLLFI